MNELALLAIGTGLGLALALTAVMVYALWATATTLRKTVNATLVKLNEQIAANRVEMSQLRAEVGLSLSRMDAERLYDASLAIQRASKSLAAQVDALQKAVFAQPAAPAIDTGLYGMEQEAEDDAPMLERQPNPLASLSEEEKNRRVQAFFERRRADSISRFGSAPPSAGSGAYASLLDDAAQQEPPAKPPADFGDEDESDVDLTGKGELGE